jgi:hypothetical protein
MERNRGTKYIWVWAQSAACSLLPVDYVNNKENEWAGARSRDFDTSDWEISEMGSSHMGQIRRNDQLLMPELHGEIVSAIVLLAGLADSAVGRREQLRLPSRGSALPSAQEGGASRPFDGGNIQIVASAGEAQDRRHRVASFFDSISAGTFRACGALATSREPIAAEVSRGQNSGARSEHDRVSMNQSDCDDSSDEILRIIDKNDDQSEVLCVFIGLKDPYWVAREGMLTDGVCTCQDVWDDYTCTSRSCSNGFPLL